MNVKLPGEIDPISVNIRSKRIYFLLTVVFLFGLDYNVRAQSQPKEITDQYQTWVSMNTTMRFSKKWGIMSDVHLRTNHSFASTSFILARLGGVYWLTYKTTLAAGYTHIWVAPTQAQYHVNSNGNWIYQQIQHASNIGKVGVSVRLRNEQRWQQLVVQDTVKGDIFSNRVRLLAYFTIPVSKNFYVPSIAVADELLVQFGKDIVYNTFDQNRIFLGIRQPISKSVSFDLGYMMVYQQRATGYQYNRNHTLRCFFYYRPDFRKHG